MRIFGYLGQKQLLTVCNRVSKSMYQSATHPSLWRKIQIIASKESEMLFRDKQFRWHIERSSQLRVLSFRYSQHVNDETLEIIAMCANPFFLRELYLDGCEKVNDEAMLKLVRPREKAWPMPSTGNFMSKNADLKLIQKQLLANENADVESHRMMTQIRQCGSRALEVISLAECRHITDAGILKLIKCQFLRRVCVLGCANLKDEGVIGLARQLTYLEEIDVGSTSITGLCLREIVDLCLALKKVNIIGCKKLNVSDDLVLKQNGINVESGEDVFRFYLIPEYNSDLPRITSSVLKTRSTLSLQKVYKYLVKKLEELNYEDQPEDDASIDQSIVIMCNGMQVDTGMQLKIIKNKHWPFDDKLLTLNYKRKDPPVQNPQSQILNRRRQLQSSMT